MPGEVLLDTNIVIALFAGESSVIDRLSQTNLMFLLSTVVGELYFGARKSARAESNLTKVETLVSKSAVLPADATTAWHYGKIKIALRAKGRPIPENDIWIASMAEQYDLTLVTRDDHFNDVEGIRVEKW